MILFVHAVVLPSSHDNGTESSTLGSAFLGGRLFLGVRLVARTGETVLSGESTIANYYSSKEVLILSNCSFNCPGLISQLNSWKCILESQAMHAHTRYVAIFFSAVENEPLKNSFVSIK